MISLIAAVARGGVIGRAGGLPWHLKDDFAYFVRLTTGKPVVMGRKTYESIPARFRPLVNRRNIVVSRDRSWSQPGVEVASDMKSALALVADAPEVMVIGGAEIYAMALPQADRLYLTEIDASVEGDAFFPPMNDGAWIVVDRTPHIEGDWRYEWVVYERA